MRAEETASGRSCPAEDTHQHHGEAEDVENVHAKEIGPRCLADGEGVFLDAKEQAERENFRAAENGLFGDGAAVSSLFTKTLGDKREGNSCEKNKERRGKCPQEVATR